MIGKRKASISISLECALLFLSILVFSWGLQAKLALYQTGPGQLSTTNSRAKLSAENRIPQTAVSLQVKTQPRFIRTSKDLTTLSACLQNQSLPLTTWAQIESGPLTPGQYFLHGPDLKRRPPPVLS
jgi:hypothetical protein